MAARKWLRFRRIDGKRVSFAWFIVLEAAEKAVAFLLTSGKRTLAEQRELFEENMIRPGVPKPGKPLTAVPSIFAPHIRRGNPAHAIDVNSLDGGETRLQAWLQRHGVFARNPVPGEAWHMEVSLVDLLRLARRLLAAKLRRKKKAEKERKRKRRERRERKRRERKLAIARRHGAQFVGIIYDACQELNLPFALGLALVEKETGFDNEYGHDRDRFGRIIWHGKTGKVVVTAENVKDYLRFARATGLRHLQMEWIFSARRLHRDRRHHAPDAGLAYAVRRGQCRRLVPAGSLAGFAVIIISRFVWSSFRHWRISRPSFRDTDSPSAISSRRSAASLLKMPARIRRISI